MPKQTDAAQAEADRQALIECIKAAAGAQGVSQGELAQLTGLNQPNISRFFSGRASPMLDTLIRVCTALDLRISVTSQKE